MLKATALAHPNLAFLKYWGKKDSQLNIPLNPSISMNLGGVHTVTTVVFDSELKQDVVYLGGAGATPKFDARITKHLDRIRAYAKSDLFAKVYTENSFPAGTGFASSASGFAALSLAASGALDLKLSERELSIFARRGSGSACRSIPDGFVEWIEGEDSESSYARVLAPRDHWDIVDVAVIVSREEKKVSSTEGHELAQGSPFWEARASMLPGRYERMRKAILDRDFGVFGREIELEAMMMHCIMMTSVHEEGGVWHPGIYYWLPDTLAIISAVQGWREQGIEVYFTLDAGPTAHLICQAKDKQAVIEAVERLGEQEKRVWTIAINEPGEGARLVGDELNPTYVANR